MPWRLLSISIILCLSWPVHLCAQEQHEESVEISTELAPVPEAGEPELTVRGFGKVKGAHQYVSSAVENLTQNIDSFFGEKRIYEEATGTYLQARGSVIYSEGGEFDFDGKFRAKIDLPQLREKVNLVIESDEDDDLEDFNRITTGSDLIDTLQDRDVSAAVEFVLKEKDRWNVSVRPGLKLKDPIETFIKFRFRRYQPLGEKWISRGTVEVGYYSEYGWENEWELNLERYIGDDYFFRSTSNVLWREDYPGMQFLGQRFQVTHFISKNSLIAFEVGVSAENRPHLTAESYFGNVRYRRNIHRGWLFFEIKPQVIAFRDNDFEAEPALVLSLEVLFGARHLEGGYKTNGGI
jgi:hypothetical protein